MLSHEFITISRSLRWIRITIVGGKLDETLLVISISSRISLVYDVTNEIKKTSYLTEYYNALDFGSVILF